MAGLQFQPVVSPLVVWAVALALVALLWVRPRHVRLPARRMAALVALRLAVVLMTLLAMLRPTFVYVEAKPQRASIVLLADDSRSMQVEDSLGDASRWDSLRSLLATSADDLATLAQSWDLKAYRFDAETNVLAFDGGKLDLPATPDGDQTALGAAIADALDREASGRVRAMLLLSDGAQRAVAPNDLPPLVAVRRMALEGIPLYTFTFGKSGGSQRADLRIDDLVANETVFSEAPTEVRGQLGAEGYANQSVRVQLLWESPNATETDPTATDPIDINPMEVVDTALVTTGPGEATEQVTLRYTPRTPGEYKVTLRAEPRDGELVTTNNEASTFITVREGGINVLYLVGTKRIGGGPGPEQRFVRAALARSPDVVVERRLLDYEPPNVDLQDALRSGAYDVVVLDDVDSRALSSASWLALADRVRDGVGLLMTGGYHSFGPGGYRNNPLSDVLPINIGPAQRQNFDEPPREDIHLPGPVQMQPATPFGERHPIMQIDPEGNTAAAWDALPPLDGANLIERRDLNANAIVLAEADDPQKHPVLVAGQSGNGRVLAFAGDSTWRWQMQGFGDAHRRFWRQAILWLAKKDEQTEGRVWIRLGGRRVTRGSRVDFTVGAEDAQRQAIDTATLDVKIDTPGGETLDVRAVPQGDAWSAVFRDTTTPGDYRISVTARNGTEELGTAEARFLVPDQDMELDRPAAEPSLLGQLAEMTSAAGGAALAPEELPTLLARLAAEPPKLNEEVIARVTYWDTWPFFLLFVALLGLEWYLRKRWGLV